MPRIAASSGPSNADLAKETSTILKSQGKVDVVNSKPIEWATFKAS
jgi:hypothetical protein